MVAGEVEQPVAEILQQEQQQHAPEVQLDIEQPPAPEGVIQINDGDGRQCIAPLMHQGQRGVGEQIPPLVGGSGKGSAMFAQVEHLPADKGQKNRGEVEQKQLHIHSGHPFRAIALQHKGWL